MSKLRLDSKQKGLALMASAECAFELNNISRGRKMRVVCDGGAMVICLPGNGLISTNGFPTSSVPAAGEQNQYPAKPLVLVVVVVEVRRH